MAACTLVLQGAAVTTGRGSHSAACITPLTPPSPTCPPHPTNQYRRLKWYSGVLHGEDFGTLFFVLLLPWRTAARRKSNQASRLTRHGHAGHRLSGGRVGARHGRSWCAGQDCGERGAAVETEGGWVASFSAAPSREPMIHAAGERRRWRRQQQQQQRQCQGHTATREHTPASARVKPFLQQLKGGPARPSGTLPRRILLTPVNPGYKWMPSPSGGVAGAT